LTHWKNKIVLITGASSGIGKELALQLTRRGASVGLVARRVEMLSEIVNEISAQGGTGLSLVADVTNAAEIRAQADRLRTELGPIDVLIANAGTGGPVVHPAQLQPAQFAKVIEINLIGAANSVAAVLPEMVERSSGRLVAISSLSAYRGLPKSGPYCASKAAMSIYFESLRLDLKNSGVEVTIIHPGFIKTPLTAGRKAQMPYMMELDDAVGRMIRGIENGKKSFAFPWQLASLVRLGMIMPNWMYDSIATRNSYRE
jgi:short-subunit dehydrogenase